MTDLIPATKSMLFGGYTNHLKEEMAKLTEKFLGVLVWYTVPESVWIDYHEYTARAIALNAPVAVKKAPKPADVFLRGCTAVEQKHQKEPTPIPDVYANYMFRKAGSDSDWICKQIVQELVDQDEHQVSFEVLADLRFHKRSFEIKFSPTLAGTNNPLVNQIVEEIKAYYEDKEMLLTAYTVRESFRHALEGPLMALSVRSSGGIYFVSTSQLDGIAGLEALADSIPGIGFHIMPLVDDEKQRAMVKEAFEDDAVGELEKLMGEMTEVLTSKGKLTTKQLVAFQERFDKYRDRNKEYEGVLQENLEKSQATLQLTKMAIQEAFAKVEG